LPTVWFIARDGKEHGPITELEFRKLVELGHLKDTDFVWHDGAADWMPGAQFLRGRPGEGPVAPVQREPARPESVGRPMSDALPMATASDRRTGSRFGILVFVAVLLGVVAAAAVTMVVSGFWF
jgi:hypothetical protein